MGTVNIIRPFGFEAHAIHRVTNMGATILIYVDTVKTKQQAKEYFKKHWSEYRLVGITTPKAFSNHLFLAS